MKFKEIETTLVCQLCKEENRKMLEGYSARHDGSNRELASYYADFVGAIVGTPAFGVSGVNKILNELTASVRATMRGDKKGKTKAYAHANKMLAMIDHFAYREASPRYSGRHVLRDLITSEELEALAAM